MCMLWSKNQRNRIIIYTRDKIEQKHVLYTFWNGLGVEEGKGIKKGKYFYISHSLFFRFCSLSMVLFQFFIGSN